MKNILAFMVLVGIVGGLGIGSLAGAATVSNVQINASGSAHATVETQPATGNSSGQLQVSSGEKSGAISTDDMEVTKQPTPIIVVHGFNRDEEARIRNVATYSIKENANISSVTVNQDTLDIGYNVPGRLFGLIPVKMNITIAAESDGVIAIHFPWYKFLVTNSYGNIGQDISAKVQRNQTNLEFAKLQTKTDIQLYIFTQIVMMLKNY